MSKRKKAVFGISIGFNIILLTIVIWGLMQMNFVKEQVLLTEAQDNLIELEALIAHQTEHNWSEPNLVTTKLGDVLNGIWLGINTGDQLGTLSKTDKQSLHQLYARLDIFPHDETYRFVELTEEDKRNFEKLREVLREAGLGFNMTIVHELDTFVKKVEIMNEKIEIPMS